MTGYLFLFVVAIVAAIYLVVQAAFGFDAARFDAPRANGDIRS